MEAKPGGVVEIADVDPVHVGLVAGFLQRRPKNLFGSIGMRAVERREQLDPQLLAAPRGSAGRNDDGRRCHLGVHVPARQSTISGGSPALPLSPSPVTKSNGMPDH